MKQLLSIVGVIVVIVSLIGLITGHTTGISLAKFVGSVLGVGVLLLVMGAITGAGK
jgi:hypothetical protein